MLASSMNKKSFVSHHGIIKQSNDTFVELIKKYPIQNQDWVINSDLINFSDVSLSDYMRFGSARRLNTLTTALYKNVWVYFIRDKITSISETSLKLDPWNRTFPSVNDSDVFKNDSFYETTDIFTSTNNKNAVCRVYITSVEGWGVYCVDYCDRNIN